MAMDLSCIRIVLVNTSHPGNIGAVARAMKNMGLAKLYLVDPLYFPHPDASSRASGADDVLEAAVVCTTLEEAVAECSLVVGASARLRTIPWPILDPREMAQRVVEHHQDDHVAIVLGRERTGLTNEELERCHFLVNIPANPDYSSLNIAAACQVLSYEVRMAALAQDPDYRKPQDRDHPVVTNDELEGLYMHFEEALTDIGFLNPDSPRQLMRRLRRLFNRCQLDQNELNILRGILTTAQQGGKPGSKTRGS